jgi:hypothetical protein
LTLQAPKLIAKKKYLLQQLSGRFRKAISFLTQILTLLLCVNCVAYARSEYDVKAVYLYNFMKFVQWPNEDNRPTPFNICIYGDSPFGSIIKKIQTFTIRGHRLKLSYPDEKGLTSCDVVYISLSEDKFLDDILATLSKSHTLTISDIDNFTQRGGMIGFITLGNVIRFNINLKRAKLASLSIRSKLLELANEVEQ